MGCPKSLRAHHSNADLPPGFYRLRRTDEWALAARTLARSAQDQGRRHKPMTAAAVMCDGQSSKQGQAGQGRPAPPRRRLLGTFQAIRFLRAATPDPSISSPHHERALVSAGRKNRCYCTGVGRRGGRRQLRFGLRPRCVLRLSSGLGRREYRHRLARRGGSRPWQRR